MKPKHPFIRVTALLALAVPLAAALPASQTDTGLGSQSAPFLTWPTDARTASMGQAGVASVSDVNAAALNPAGLSQVSGEQFSLNQAFLFQGTDLENAAAAIGVNNHTALGLSVTYLNVGTVDASSYNPATGAIVSAGTFNPYYYSVGVTYAQELFSGLNLGASIKVVAENIDNAMAATPAFDLGAQYGFAQYVPALQGLSLGSSVQNLGPQLTGADLPSAWRSGVSYQLPFFSLRNSLLLNGDVQVPLLAAEQTTCSVGAELRYGRFLSLRAGYQTGDFGGVTGLTGVTAGAGFGMNWWQVDYAWVPEGDLGLADQFSFSAKF